MIVTNYKIRQKIVKEELQGKNRVNYRKELITNLFDVHTQEFGRGYSIQSFYQIKQFYLFYRGKYNIEHNNNIFQMVSGKFKFR